MTSLDHRQIVSMTPAEFGEEPAYIIPWASRSLDREINQNLGVWANLTPLKSSGQFCRQVRSMGRNWSLGAIRIMGDKSCPGQHTCGSGLRAVAFDPGTLSLWPGRS